MALVADDGRDRAEQLLLLTERLTALIAEETRRIEARLPPLEGAEAEEKNRLANAYRLELARIKQEPSLISSAPADMLNALRQRTVKLHEALARHETELGAIKLITEGLVHAMADEVARQRSAGGAYGARGAIEAPVGPIPTVLDRSA
ncbi:MAG TPA: flagellar basal-body protein FlbY [Vitreimonas sp.]|uniref:flagellar basal-body protein FlbY n=1 Tax=Vitreimonas sp. TaxID=3069702 RepID=UPI002D6B9B70|nr:flagellar basal-body protein FlbY [Vitreimonas sp.]HYD88266.1 flagellar basal-body protein FlbY [Vitreimonas sp.]